MCIRDRYNVVQDLIAYMKSSKINYNDLLLDYIPYLLSSHLKALKDPSLSEDLVFEHYSKLTLYDSKRYPTLFTDIIQRKLKTRSLLQRSFLDSFLNELVFGRIIDSIMEPYYLLEGLNRICMKVKLNSSMNIKQKVVYSKSNYSSWWSVSKVKQKISQMARLVSYSTSIKSPNIDNTSVPEIPFLQRYVFSLFTDDFFKLSMRKPFLFSMCRTLQHWISKSNNLNKFMYNMFGNIIRTKITSPMTIGNFFSSLRHSMFPNDNMMGPPKEVPIGDAFLEFREECICNLWDVCKTYKLARTLAIERSDIADLVICLSKNRDCNKLLLYKIIDCVVAQLI